MTTVTIQSGACGFATTVTAEKTKGGKISVRLETQCSMVQEMSGDIALLDRFVPLTGFANNPIYTSAAKHLKHVACPVLSGILKALEVEGGLNVPKDATITFVKEK